MSKTELTSSGGKLTDTAAQALFNHRDMIACECPGKLIEILNSIRDFQKYTASCIQDYPKDADTHRWLLGAAENLDALLSNTILQLARMEGFIDGENQIVDRKPGT